jgi:hypothetical protein
MKIRKLICAAIAGPLMVGAVAAVGCAAPGDSAAQTTTAGVRRSKDASAQQRDSTQAEPPRVEDCGIVTIGSPTKFVCNGKVYTHSQLSQLRQNKNKKPDTK